MSDKLSARLNQIVSTKSSSSKKESDEATSKPSALVPTAKVSARNGSADLGALVPDSSRITTSISQVSEYTSVYETNSFEQPTAQAPVTPPITPPLSLKEAAKDVGSKASPVKEAASKAETETTELEAEDKALTSKSPRRDAGLFAKVGANMRSATSNREPSSAFNDRVHSKRKFPVLGLVLLFVLASAVTLGVLLSKSRKRLDALENQLGLCKGEVRTALSLASLRPWATSAKDGYSTPELHDPLWRVYTLKDGEGDANVARQPLLLKDDAQYVERMQQLESQLEQQKQLNSEIYYRMQRWKLIARFYWNDQYGVAAPDFHSTMKEFAAQSPVATDDSRPYTEKTGSTVRFNSLLHLKYNSFLVNITDDDFASSEGLPQSCIGPNSCQKRAFVPCYVDDLLTPHPLIQHVEPLLTEITRLRSNLTSCTTETTTCLIKLNAAQASYEKQLSNSLQMREELESMAKSVNESQAVVAKVLDVAGNYDLSLQRLLLLSLESTFFPKQSSKEFSNSQRAPQVPVSLSIKSSADLEQTIKLLKAQDKEMADMVNYSTKSVNQSQAREKLVYIGKAAGAALLLLIGSIVLAVLGLGERLQNIVDSSSRPGLARFIDRMVLIRHKLLVAPSLRLYDLLFVRPRKRLREWRRQSALRSAEKKARAASRKISKPSAPSKVRAIDVKAVLVRVSNLLSRILGKLKALAPKRPTKPARSTFISASSSPNHKESGELYTPTPPPRSKNLAELSLLSIPPRAASAKLQAEVANEPENATDSILLKNSVVFSPSIFAPQSNAEALDNLDPEFIAKKSNAALSMHTAKEQESVYESQV